MRLSNPFFTRSFDADEGESRQVNQSFIFWCAAIILFGVVAIPPETALLPFAAMLDRVYASPDLLVAAQKFSGKFASHDREGVLQLITDSIVVPVRHIGFLASVITLLYWPFKALKRAPWFWIGGRSRLLKSLYLMAIVGLLVIPFRLRSLGDSYGAMSISPFDEPLGVLYRRLLMPALAYLLGLSGYVFYFVLSMGVALVFVYLLLLWLEKSDVKLAPYTLVSLLTSGFFIYAYEMPGYPDQLAMIFVMFTMLLPLSDLGKLSFAALSLATHEASILMLAPVVLFFFSRKEQKQFLMLISLYCLFVLSGVSFSLQSLIDPHVTVGASHPWEYLVERPALAFAGVFVAYKLFWVVNAVGAFISWKVRERRLSLLIVTALVLPLMIIPFAVDTSRFAAFGFIGLLLSLKFLFERGMLSRQTLTALSIINLLVPSFYVGLNEGIVFQPGLYDVVWGWIFR